jgi:hypothetical protein
MAKLDAQTCNLGVSPVFSKEAEYMIRFLLIFGLFFSAVGHAKTPSGAVTVPATKEWLVQDGAFDISHFRFHDGGTLPILHLHYLTLGTLHRDSQGHTDNAVPLLHGTGGDSHSLLDPLFSNELFGPGQPLDITKYFLILPDDIGHGQSSKPSDGLHMRFPAYDYDDMVAMSTRHARRRPSHRPFASDPWYLHGLHADLCLGRNFSDVLRCFGAVRMPPGRNRRA